MPASVISLYCTYLCYSGLASEPREYACNGLHKHSQAVSTGTLTVGLLTTVLSVVYSAVRAGSSTTLLSPPSSPRAGQCKFCWFYMLVCITLLIKWPCINVCLLEMKLALFQICCPEDFVFWQGFSSSNISLTWSEIIISWIIKMPRSDLTLYIYLFTLFIWWSILI